MKIKKSILDALVEFARRNGKMSNVAMALEIEDEEVPGYLAGLKQLHREVYDTWIKPEAVTPPPPVEEKPAKGKPGRKARPAPEPEEEAPPPAKGGAIVIQHEEDESTTIKEAVGLLGQKVTVPAPETSYRLKDKDGQLHPLEVFSNTPRGIIFIVPEPKDIRSVTLRGKTFDVDLVSLRRDPDGMTEGFANSKLLVVAEMND